MCFVFIASHGLVSKVPADALEAKNRIEPAKKSAKPVAKKNKAPVYRPTEPAPLQRGGTLISSKHTPYWSKDDSSEHYRQRCGEHNHRQQACSKTSRRRQTVHY